MDEGGEGVYCMSVASAGAGKTGRALSTHADVCGNPCLFAGLGSDPKRHKGLLYSAGRPTTLKGHLP